MFAIVCDDAGQWRLENRSPTDQIIVHGHYYDPSELLLRDETGKSIPSFDERSRMKFDSKPVFVSVKAGEGIDLFDVNITSRSKKHKVKWGPFIFSDLKAGSYTAQIQWTSGAQQYYFTAENGEKVTTRVWKGNVKSREFELKVP